MNDPEPKHIAHGIYKHTKSGKRYEVIGVSLETETNEQHVIYKPLYESEFELFARPYDMFVEVVEIDGIMQPRFEHIQL